MTTAIGKLGTAVLEGFLQSSLDVGEDVNEDVAKRHRFLVCVNSVESEQRLRLRFVSHRKSVMLLVKDNVRGVEAAHVILLGCKPNGYQQILAEVGMKEALEGKVLLNMLAGVTSSDVCAAIYGDHQAAGGCVVARAIPNIAASLRKSVTVVERSDRLGHSKAEDVAIQLFSRVGRVKVLSSDVIEAGVVISAAAPAFFAALSGAMIKSKSLKDLSPSTLAGLVAGSMWSCGHLLFNGNKPQEIRHAIATPGGSTARGLTFLEDRGVERAMEDVVQETLAAYHDLGKVQE